MDAPDSLEGWIAVRDNPFIEHQDTKTRLSFHVAWNDTEGKIAITCLPRSRVASDDDCLGWSGAFTFSEVQAIHDQLTLVHPSLAPYVPQLPVEPRGLWAYILHNEPPDDDICVKIHDYLQKAHDVCGQTLLISTLFEEHTYEEYFENISALKRRVYDEAVAIADDQLQNVLFLREGSVNMLDMCEVYKQEDEALYKWNIAMAELYNYLIQPFLDMREMALGKVREAKNGLTDPNLGDRRKGEYAVMFSEWQENYVHALDRIQELYIEYYTSTVELLEAAKQRMLEDQTQFGRTTFQMTGMDRLYRISEDLCLDKLQRQQNKKKNCENQRDKVKQEIVSLMETPGGIVTELDSLEESVYEWQVKVHKHHLGIISEEERLLRMHIKSLKQEQLDEENEVYFYDTVEDPGEISSDAESASSSRKSPRLQCLNRKLAALFRKRAQIRNKKRALMKGRSEKTKQLTEVEQQVVTHHSIQIKREERQLELEKNHAFIDDERRKTMERLRQYKMKYPSPSTIRPQCRPAPKKLKKRRRKVSDRKSSLPKDDDITDACKLTSKLNDIKPSLLPAPPASLDLSSSLPPPPPPHFPPPMFTPPPPPSFPSQFPPSPSLPVNVQRKDSVDSAPVENNELVTSGMLKTAKSGLKSRTKQQASLKQKQASDPVSDMMDIIRAGVKLRPMNCAANNNSSSSPFKQHAVATPAEQHTQQLKEAFMRISARLQLSEEDDESDYSAEFQDSDP